MRMRRVGRLVLLLVVALAIVVVVVWLDLTKLLDADPEPLAATRDTTEVRLSAIGETFSFDGTVAYSAPISVVTGGDAYDTLSPDTSVDSNDVLFRVAGEPVVALEGAVPMFRDITLDSAGIDVQQLERALVDLGFDPEGTVTIDETFTTNTEAMVERWQRSTGAAVTGEVAQASVVFISAPMRVSGTNEPGAVMSLTGQDREVVLTVPVVDIDTLTTGDVVSIALPDRSEMPATIVSMTPGADATYEVVAALASEAELPALDVIEVAVSWRRETTSDALSVPPGALVRLDSGTYALEVVGSSGTDFVPVAIGARSGTLVEVSGEGIEEGTMVVNP